MPKIEEFTVHLRSPFQGLFSTAVCGKMESPTHLVVAGREFARRVAGVCKTCAASPESREADALFQSEGP